jgi:RimJ/RimL family protein N-acetyltransferase
MNIQICEIEAVTKNAGAIRAYEKAGFRITKTFIKNGVEWNHMELKEQ